MSFKIPQCRGARQGGESIGIDPSDSRNVLITRCRIDTGDDDVAIKAGHKVPGREFASENITVRDCTFLHGHGMSIGSETLGGVRNVLVKHCIFENTDNGIRIKSRRGRGGLVEDIVYEDIEMTNVDPAVTFTCEYASNSSKDPVEKAAPQEAVAQPAAGGIPVFRDICITHLTARCPREAGEIIGLPESKIRNVTFKDANISAAGGFRIQNAAGIQFKQSRIRVAEGEPFLLENAEVKGTSASTGQ
jgi:polygalacturonase